MSDRLQEWCERQGGRWHNPDGAIPHCDFNNGTVQFAESSGMAVWAPDIDEDTDDGWLEGVWSFGPERVDPNPGDELDQMMALENYAGEFIIEGDGGGMLRVDGPY